MRKLKKITEPEALKYESLKRFNMVKLTKNSISRTTLIINIVLFIFSLIFQLVVSNATGLKGEELARLEKEKLQLQKNISELEYQSYNLASLVLVEQKAREQGFEKIKEAIAALPRNSDSQVAVLTTY